MKKKEKQYVPDGIQKKTNTTFITIISCLIFAVIVFIVLLNVEKNIMTSYEKTKVVVCKQNIEKQVDINDKNLKDYFELKEMPTNLIPEGAYKKLKDIPEGITSRELIEKEILLNNAIESKKSIVKDIENPIETAITLKSLDKAVGGTLRRGDRVNISVIGEDQEKQLLIENVFISAAMNSSGDVLTRDSKDAALTFNIITSKENAQLLKNIVNKNNDLTLVKLNNVKY